MNKEMAAKTLDLKIEETSGSLKFLTASGEEVTLAGVEGSIASNRLALDETPWATEGAVRAAQWSHLKELGAWIEIKSHLEKESGRPRRTQMPSIFDDEQFREMMTVITSHRLYKTVDTNRTFAHTVNCVTCGELSVDIDQEFHIAHMLTDAGFGKLPEVSAIEDLKQ